MARRHCLWCLYACPGEAYEELQSDRQPGVGVERIQRNFEPSGGRLAKDSNQRRARKADFVCRFVDGSWKRPERSCLRLDARPISGMNLRPKCWPCQHSTYIV